MKTFLKLLTFVLALSLIFSALILCTGAVNTEPGADPKSLTPGSDKVIFIKDAPRDEDYQVIGELTGDGTGSDAENPLRPSEHEKFDPTAERKRYDYTTAFYQATEMLETTGGTIVICGPVHLGIMECADNGATTVRDAYTANFKNNVIKFTSVYDGVDYRETAGAKLSICTPAMVTVLGSSIWENIDIETIGSERAITFDDYCTRIGEGVKCYPSDSAFEGVASNYVSLGAGHRHAGSKNENPTLLVQSGTYNKITAAMWGTAATATSENTNTNLTIEGTTTVLGFISGTVQAKSLFSGNVNITINSGTFECDINGVGPTGMLNTDGVVNITINGGNFKNGWSISSAAMGVTNNMPSSVTLDFSGWKEGDLNGLAYADALVTDIKNVIYPEWASNPGCPPFEPQTEEVDDGTVYPENSETQPETTVGSAETKPVKTEIDETNNDNPKETTDTVSHVSADDDGSNLGLIIGIAAVVVIAAVVIIIVTKKKKA